MFLRDNLARRGHKFGAEFAAPGSEFEGLALPSAPLNGRDYFHVS